MMAIPFDSDLAMLVVTATLAALLALFQLKLAFAVIALRRRHQVSLGDGGHAELERANRAVGNLVEYAPIMLILLACLEANGAPHWLAAVLAIPFLAGRWIHPIGLGDPDAPMRNRVLGMHLTIWPIVGAAVANLGWLVVVALR